MSVCVYVLLLFFGVSHRHSTIGKRVATHEAVSLRASKTTPIRLLPKREKKNQAPMIEDVVDEWNTHRTWYQWHLKFVLLGTLGVFVVAAMTLVGIFRAVRDHRHRATPRAGVGWTAHPRRQRVGTRTLLQGNAPSPVVLTNSRGHALQPLTTVDVTNGETVQGSLPLAFKSHTPLSGDSQTHWRWVPETTANPGATLTIGQVQHVATRRLLLPPHEPDLARAPVQPLRVDPPTPSGARDTHRGGAPPALRILLCPREPRAFATGLHVVATPGRPRLKRKGDPPRTPPRACAILDPETETWVACSAAFLSDLLGDQLAPGVRERYTLYARFAKL